MGCGAGFFIHRPSNHQPGQLPRMRGRFQKPVGRAPTISGYFSELSHRMELKGRTRSPRDYSHVCPTLCDSMDCSLPGSSVPRILQARNTGVDCHVLLRESSWPRDWTCISCVSIIAGRFFTTKPLGKPYYSLETPNWTQYQNSSNMVPIWRCWDADINTHPTKLCIITKPMQNAEPVCQEH